MSGGFSGYVHGQRWTSSLAPCNASGSEVTWKDVESRPGATAYEENKHYWVVTRESGTSRSDLPIF